MPTKNMISSKRMPKRTTDMEEVYRGVAVRTEESPIKMRGECGGAPGVAAMRAEQQTPGKSMKNRMVDSDS